MRGPAADGADTGHKRLLARELQLLVRTLPGFVRLPRGTITRRCCAGPVPHSAFGEVTPGYGSVMIESWSVGDVDARLSTRQLWVLRAVAAGRIDRDSRYCGLCTLDGRSVWWTVVVLALRGLVAFDLDPLRSPYLTRRGQTRLDG
jgi:hypothetical protein